MKILKISGMVMRIFDEEEEETAAAWTTRRFCLSL
jgi:hypothetical protein